MSKSLENMFSDNMESFFPFERKPKLAVAVSGGADSLALTILADNWVKKFCGSVIAITVDHSIRKESENEAKYVSSLLNDIEIEHRILKYLGATPKTRIQESARQYRYELLGKFCEDEKILHLLVGHHSSDQKETYLMRKWSKSGFIGLAGMSAVRELHSYRIIRPLLNFDPSALKIFLKKNKIRWIEDNSNSDEAFLRVKARKHLSKEPNVNQKKFAVERVSFEKKLNRWLACFAEVSQAGFVSIDFDEFRGLRDKYREYILSRAIVTVAGLNYPPSTPRLIEISNHFKNSINQKTLGGCLVLKKGNKLFCCREIRAKEPEVNIIDKETVIWDRRFRIKLSEFNKKSVKLLRLGRKGFDQLSNAGYYKVTCKVPKVAYMSLPALWERGKVVVVPQFGVKQGVQTEMIAVFSPLQPLVPPNFVVVN